jgi:hypothetical protein
MRTCVPATLLLFAGSLSAARLPYTEQQVISYAKSVDVRMLDPSLPSERLENWLQSGPPHVHVYSYVVADTCNLKPLSAKGDYPLCVRVAFGSDNVRGFFLVQVGTESKGIVGHPQVYGDINIVNMKEPSAWTGTMRLSDLPTVLDHAHMGDVPIGR